MKDSVLLLLGLGAAGAWYYYYYGQSSRSSSSETPIKNVVGVVEVSAPTKTILAPAPNGTLVAVAGPASTPNKFRIINTGVAGGRTAPGTHFTVPIVRDGPDHLY